MGGNISMPHRVEHFVAEIEVQHFVFVAHGLDQPRAVGMPVDTIQNLAFFPGAVENFGQHGVVAGQNAALKGALLPGEVAHPACRIRGGTTFSAISRVRLTSMINSSSGGMLSSRSIMVETRPKRFKAATQRSQT